ncbi:MAG: prephenate dehydrogenase/arogenate dehydrogenase family protein [Bacteroidota bacterium]
MSIKNISIIGLGLIGGSIAKALRKADADYIISAYDVSDSPKLALDDGTIDAVLSSIDQSLDSDLIFISSPVDVSFEIFKELAPKLKPNSVLTDVCSVKSTFKEKWDQIESNGFYFGGHPMTGKEDGGYTNSDPLLFENALYIISDKDENNPIFHEFTNVIKSFGSNILHIPAKQHDVIAASVSHLPQLVSVALVNAASLKTDEYNFLDLAAGGFRDMTRIASSDFNIWKSIISGNKDQIITAMEKFSYDLNTLKKWIIDNKELEISEYFESARKNRDEIPKNTKGFLSPLHDLFIFIEDKPGAVSKISTALYEKGINIKDIELLKIREGSGGTFRVSFESRDELLEASEILGQKGFSTEH